MSIYLWLLALAIAWIGYIFLNWNYSSGFEHLDHPAALTVGDWLRQTRVGYGASRNEEPSGLVTLTKSELMKDVVVLRGPYTRLLAEREVERDGKKRKEVLLRVDADSLTAFRLSLEAECNPTPDGPLPMGSFAGERAAVYNHFLLQLDMLRLRHAVIPGVTDKVRANPPKSLDLWESKNLEGVRKTEQDFWAIDPLGLPAGELAARVEDYSNRVENAWATLKAPLVDARPLPGRVWKNHSDGQQAFLTDLNKLVPFDANPSFAFDQGANPLPHPGGLTIAYLPPPRQGSTPAKELVNIDALAVAVGGWAELARPPLSESPKAGYLYAMEFGGVGSWQAGRTWSARFLLLDTLKPGWPIINPRQPHTDIVTRWPGWYGFRPTAVRVSEEQLAARFFPHLDELQTGAGIQGQLRPKTDEEVARYEAFFRSLLTRTLGQVAASAPPPPQSAYALSDPKWLDDKTRTGDGPSAQFAPAPKPLDEWVVWPRRWNGGTGWGAIQFLVVLLTVRFFLEFVAALVDVRDLSPAGTPNRIGRAVRWVLRLNRKKVREGANESESASLSSAAAVARSDPSEANYSRVVRIAINRTHTLRAITAALPLVGFLGTVAGLSNSLIGASGVSSESAAQRQSALQAMEIALGTAFDKSMLAFVAAITCTLAERWMVWRIHRIPESMRDEGVEVL